MTVLVCCYTSAKTDFCECAGSNVAWPGKLRVIYLVATFYLTVCVCEITVLQSGEVQHLTLFREQYEEEKKFNRKKSDPLTVKIMHH